MSLRETLPEEYLNGGGAGRGVKSPPVKVAPLAYNTMQDISRAIFPANRGREGPL